MKKDYNTHDNYLYTYLNNELLLRESDSMTFLKRIDTLQFRILNKQLQSSGSYDEFESFKDQHF